MKIELIYDRECPNVEDTRRELRMALSMLGIDEHWREWVRGAPGSPGYALSFGSPTILIDGDDVAGTPPSEGADCCRLYDDEEGGYGKAPRAATIARKLKEVMDRKKSLIHRSSAGKRWMRGGFAAMPGVGFALLPGISCPACWPAYAGLLSSLGVGFFNYTRYLFPFTLGFMVLAVGSMFYGAGRRKGYKPAAMGLAACSAIILGRFVFDYAPILYGGTGLLVAASLWDVWPKRTRVALTCPDCDRPNSGENVPKGSL